jgi:hypothetical protein
MSCYTICMYKNTILVIGFAVAFLLLATIAFSFFKPSQPISTPIPTPTPAPMPGPASITNNPVATTTDTQTVTTPTKLRISTLSPASGTEGTLVTITGNGFSPTSNMIYFGGTLEAIASSNGTAITFTISPCPYSPSGRICPAHLLAGPGNVYVTNGNGTSNTLIFTVTQQS